MAFYGSPAWSGAGGVMECVPATAKRKAPSPGKMVDDFPCFSSSPALKIRRLDAELTRNLPEEAAVAAASLGQPLVEEKTPRGQQNHAVVLAGVGPSLKLDESRAIVLYKPVDRPIFDYQPSLDALLRVDPDVISGLKDQCGWLGQRRTARTWEEGEPSTDDREAAASECSKALVPWVPPRASSIPAAPSSPEAMDVEEDGDGRPCSATTTAAAAAAGLSEGFRLWNQHCLPPQLSPSASTPAVMWTWG